MHYLEHGRRDIAELAALAELAGIADNNERNGVRRVRGEGLAVVADHAVRVAVIRSDERYTALGSDEVNESADAGVDRFNSLDSRIEHAGVADHVAVCEVEDYRIVDVLVDLIDKRVGDFVCAHLGLEVIGRDIGGVNEDSVLALVDSLFAAVEEECDMGIFCELGDSQLAKTRLAEYLAQRHVYSLGLESHFDVGHLRLILSHADIENFRLFLALEAVKIGIDKSSGDFTRSVGAEVEEHDAVSVLDGRGVLADAGDDELVGHAVGI